MNRAETLDAAKACVCGQRQEDYGNIEDNFTKIAELWEVYMRDRCVGGTVDITILPEDVAVMMCLLKIARIASGHAKADNWIDIAGYAACGAELEEGK